MKKIIALIFCVTTAGSVMATLPPLTPEAQEAKTLADAKTAYGAKVGAYQLCQSMNRVADRFKVSGTPAPAACTAPPPFVAPVTAAAPAAVEAPVAAAPAAGSEN